MRKGRKATVQQEAAGEKRQQAETRTGDRSVTRKHGRLEMSESVPEELPDDRAWGCWACPLVRTHCQMSSTGVLPQSPKQEYVPLTSDVTSLTRTTNTKKKHFIS